MLAFCKQISVYNIVFGKVTEPRSIYSNRTVKHSIKTFSCKQHFSRAVIYCIKLAFQGLLSHFINYLRIILRIMQEFWSIMQTNYKKF